MLFQRISLYFIDPLYCLFLFYFNFCWSTVDLRCINFCCMFISLCSITFFFYFIFSFSSTLNWKYDLFIFIHLGTMDSPKIWFLGNWSVNTEEMLSKTEGHSSTWKQPKRLTTDEWIKKVWCVYTHNGILFDHKKNKIMSFVATLKDPELHKLNRKR